MAENTVSLKDTPMQEARSETTRESYWKSRYYMKQEQLNILVDHIIFALNGFRYYDDFYKDSDGFFRERVKVGVGLIDKLINDAYEECRISDKMTSEFNQRS